MVISHPWWTVLSLVFLQVHFLPFQVALTSSSSGSDTCAPGWMFFNNSCYKLFTNKATWSQARHECEVDGSYLVTLGSAEENSFVYNTFAKLKSVWIGLYRNPVNFHWVTNEHLDYQNWITAYGDDVDEKCVEMTDYSSFHGKWNDKGCSHTLEYICEQDQYRQGFFEIRKGVALYNHVMMTETTTMTDMGCALKCLRTKDCKSINFYSNFWPSLCQLNDALMRDFPEDVIQDQDAAYIVKVFN